MVRKTSLRVTGPSCEIILSRSKCLRDPRETRAAGSDKLESSTDVHASCTWKVGNRKGPEEQLEWQTAGIHLRAHSFRHSLLVKDRNRTDPRHRKRFRRRFDNDCTYSTPREGIRSRVIRVSRVPRTVSVDSLFHHYKLIFVLFGFFMLLFQRYTLRT